jgi:2-(1,2-epoxy-1,2-dihydrophenyl)acetyl-CoA isomerase
MRAAAYESIELTVSDGLARLTLNRPDQGNPFDGRFCADFCDAINCLAARNDVRVILLDARGRFFSVGGDIEQFARTVDVLPQMILKWTADLHMGTARLARLDAPVVACVHATAMGGAVAMIAGCDVVFGATSARFGAAYPQIGYSCDAGASFALASRMGLARARRFLLLNELLSAEQAAQAGLVDHVVDDSKLIGAADNAALQLSRGPTRAYGEIRRLLRGAFAQSFELQLEDEAQALMRAASTLDAREGIAAFLERRQANFQGR